MPELREDKTARESHIEDLVKHAKSGNRYSFEKLIVIFQEDIFRMAYYRTGSRMDAEDLTQDIFTQAFRSVSSLKEVSRFKSWLYRIAVNRVRDFYKKKRVLVFLGSRDDLADFYRNGTEDAENIQADDSMVRQEFWGHVRNLFKILSKREREVFMLRFFDQLNIREISAVINKSESSVKTYLYRALNKIKIDPEFFKIIEGESG